MPVNTEKFADAAKSNLDSVLTIAGTAFSCVERLAALNLNTSRNVLASAVDSSKALLGVKNVEELAAVQIDVARPALENVISYSRAAYAICVETAEELNKIVDAQLNVLKAETVAAIDVARLKDVRTPLIPLLRFRAEHYPPDVCPMCKEGMPLQNLR